MSEITAKPIKLLQTAQHPCSYLDDKIATTVLIDPSENLDPYLHGQLAAMGFRRSGAHTYKPMCRSCHACVPARIVAREFMPNKSQKRCLKYNMDLVVQNNANVNISEHYPLYARYIAERHAGGDMFPPTEQQYIEFLIESPGNVTYIEFRLDNRLIGCAVVDVFPNALSAIYTYFDPSLNKRSLGTFAILQQVLWAQQLNVSHVYLGYWIQACNKMSYKVNYHPVELLQGKTWVLRK
jgi:arginyl-tRNA--protein-N-Asp/Glu arginylyltransferase